MEQGHTGQSGEAWRTQTQGCQLNKPSSPDPSRPGLGGSPGVCPPPQPASRQGGHAAFFKCPEPGPPHLLFRPRPPRSLRTGGRGTQRSWAPSAPAPGAHPGAPWAGVPEGPPCSPPTCAIRKLTGPGPWGSAGSPASEAGGVDTGDPGDRARAGVYAGQRGRCSSRDHETRRLSGAGGLI